MWIRVILGICRVMSVLYVTLHGNLKLTSLMHNTLTLMTWNVTGIMSSSSYLCDILQSDRIDICGISEHWLYEHDHHFMDCINSQYFSYTKSDVDLRLPGNRRVGKGGVAIMWNKRLHSSITPLDIDDDRVIGIQFEISTDVYMYIFQVYLPSSNHSINYFKEYIDVIFDLYSQYCNKGVVIFIGDFNAHINGRSFVKPMDTRGLYLNNLLCNANLVPVNTMNFCSGADATFVTYDGMFRSMIDHILVGCEQVDMVTFCSIVDDENALTVSRHRPIVCQLRLPYRACLPSTSDYVPRTNWKKAQPENIYNYQQQIHDTTEVLTCNMSTSQELDTTYVNIVTQLKQCSDICIPKSSFKHFLKPYWNQELGQLHRVQSELRINWVQQGRPRDRNNAHYIKYKEAKRKFRNQHRQCVNLYMQQLDEDIDRAAELNNDDFWKLYNHRRNRSCVAAGAEMNFDGTVIRDAKRIANSWGHYFETLYSPTSVSNYMDTQHKEAIDSEMQNLDQCMRNCVYDSTSARPFTGGEVSAAIRKQGKKGKASGCDGIVYEHLVYGGPVLYDELAHFYTNILYLGHVPTEMKKGIIVTLHKGGNKRKDDPNNYRAITLSSVLLKIYERLLLDRLPSNIVTPSPLQGGFQKGCSCQMTSFLLRESIYYAKENSSKLYVCFLDAQKAFDTVWHNGLFYKLHKAGISVEIMKSFMDMYTDMNSQVLYQGHTSTPFKVLQGTKQGGVSSPFMYISYINDLITQLASSSHGLVLYDVSCCCPTVADDMVLVSLSRNGLNAMLDICHQYSQKWRYKYNASKCNVIVFNEKPLDYTQHNRIWKLGDEIIHECEDYTHLGIICNKYMNVETNVISACSKLRRTFFGLTNTGINKFGFHPLTAKRIYESVVLPRALYGCELWNHLLPGDIIKLERVHRLCVKYMQDIPRRTKTDIALNTIGCLPIEAIIDKSKLRFFGQLCMLRDNKPARVIFHNRLSAYLMNKVNFQGFMPDIYRILQKYSLNCVLESYLNSGQFVSKCMWKRLVNEAIVNYERQTIETRLQSNEPLASVIQISDPLSPCPLWTFSRYNINRQLQCRSAVVLMCRQFTELYPQYCPRCCIVTENKTFHCIYECLYSEVARATLWRNLIEKCGSSFFSVFMTLSPEQQTYILYGQDHSELNTYVDLETILDVTVCFLHTIRLMYDL